MAQNQRSVSSSGSCLLAKLGSGCPSIHFSLNKRAAGHAVFDWLDIRSHRSFNFKAQKAVAAFHDDVGKASVGFKRFVCTAASNPRDRLQLFRGLFWRKATCSIAKCFENMFLTNTRLMRTAGAVVKCVPVEMSNWNKEAPAMLPRALRGPSAPSLFLAHVITTRGSSMSSAAGCITKTLLATLTST